MNWSWMGFVWMDLGPGGLGWFEMVDCMGLICDPLCITWMNGTQYRPTKPEKSSNFKIQVQ